MDIELSTWMIIVIALIPAIFMMVYIYLQDNHEKEPLGLLLGIFGLGILSAVPAIILEWLAEKVINLTFGGMDLVYLAVTAFFGVAVIEEGVKFLAAYILTWRNRHFNYKFDGIVYCLFASMGFAGIENVMYLLMENTDTVLSLGISRGLLAIPCHGMCAIFMGYYYGNAKYAKSYGDRAGCRRNLLIGFLVACSLHGFYDFCLFTQRVVFMILFIIFVIVADIFTLIRIHKAKKTNQKMYEAPKFRQYWVNANPYQSYGGYQAPAYGAYTYGSNTSMVQTGEDANANSRPFVQPQYGMPEPDYRSGAGQYGQPRPGAGQYGQPQPGAGQYGQPQSGAGQYGQSQPGAGQYGQPQSGASQYGQPQSGTSKYAPSQGAGQPFVTEKRSGYEPTVVGKKQEYKPEIVGEKTGRGLSYSEHRDEEAGTYREPDYSTYYSTTTASEAGNTSQGSPVYQSNNSQSNPGNMSGGMNGNYNQRMMPSSMRGVQIHCPVCGEINNFNAFYCTGCGASLHQIR